MNESQRKNFQVSNLGLGNIANDKYLVILSFAAMIGAALLPDSRASELVQTVVILTATVFDFLVIGTYFVATKDAIEWSQAHRTYYRASNYLPVEKREAQNPVIQYTPPKEPDHPSAVVRDVSDKLVFITPTSAVKTPAENIPSRDFLVAVFGGAGQGGRIPTEPMMIALGTSANTSANKWNSKQTIDWLRDMDAKKITRKAWESERGNAPRYIMDGMTLDRACVIYEYPPTPLADVS